MPISSIIPQHKKTWLIGATQLIPPKMFHFLPVGKCLFPGPGWVQWCPLPPPAFWSRIFFMRLRPGAVSNRLATLIGLIKPKKAWEIYYLWGLKTKGPLRQEGFLILTNFVRLFLSLHYPCRYSIPCCENIMHANIQWWASLTLRHSQFINR